MTQTPFIESVYWKLFKSVRPLFASDIPWRLQDDSQDDEAAKFALENSGGLIKACMLEIPFHFQVEHFDHDELADFIVDHLQPFLRTLQDLVGDEIMEHADTAAMKTVKEEFWKLKALGLRVQSSTTGIPDVSRYHKFLRLDQDPSQLSKTFSGIGDFNQRLVDEMSKERSNRSVLLKPKRTPPSPAGSHLWLQSTSNASFWSSSQKLFKALVHNLRSCKLSTHSAMLNLKGIEPPQLQDRQAEFDILLPMCPNTDCWQETSCRVLYESPFESDNDDSMLPETLCKAAQEAKDYDSLLCIHVHEENFRYDLPENKFAIYPNALPTMTISQLIECGYLKGLREFQLRDRWILALNLARSLLQLHNGPWLQTLWTSETLFFLCEYFEEGRKLCNIHNPFVSCTISDSPPSLPKPSHFDRYPLLLTFGQFLLELANGEKLPVVKTTAGKLSPYRTLNNNFNEKNTGSLTEAYKEAIKGCLEFQKCVRTEDHKDEEVRIRIAIFKNIVQPLERNLQSFSNVSESKPGSSLHAPCPKDLHLNTEILLASPRSYGSLPLRIFHSPASGTTRRGQVEVSEAENIELLTLSEGHEDDVASRHGVLRLEDVSHDVLDAHPCAAGVGRIPSANKWFNMLKPIHSMLNSDRMEDLDQNEVEDLVKVAVLDTGIDLKHPVFERFLQDGRLDTGLDLVEQGKDIVDLDGHGTHVCHTLLRTAPYVRLYPIRVLRTRYTEESTPYLVKKAIMYAIDKNVDIISMSFAFEDEEPEIKEALNNANNRVLMFAAASNNRALKKEPIGYPARVSDRVICVNSSTINNQRSRFSPKGIPGLLNFSVVGEDVEAAWLSSEADREIMRSMNGTSMATPIMAGIAAMLLDFAKKDWPKLRDMQDWKYHKTQLWETAGMKSVFKRCMTDNLKIDGSYNFLKPWLLLAKDPENIVRDITNALQSKYK